MMGSSIFLSTPSARRATVTDFDKAPTRLISIHALREEGDRSALTFNQKGDLFLSTPSARRATIGCTMPVFIVYISIHALREEGDDLLLLRRCTSVYFYPRPPRGGRREVFELFLDPVLFLSTPSARRATRRAVWCAYGVLQFLSTPSARRATSASARR